MVRRQILIFLVTISLMTPIGLLAKDKTVSFGFTNISKVLMLHPLMAKYKVKEGRFLPEALGKNQGKTGKKRLFSIRKKRKIYVAKVKKLEEKMQKIDKNYEKSLASLSKKYKEKNPPTQGTNQYNEERSKIENKFWVNRKEAQEELRSAQAELAEINNENSLLQLTSADETNQVFKMMLDDIYEAVALVAKHYKIDFVMNSSFTVERTPVNPAFTPVNPMAGFFNKKFNRDAKEVLFKHGSDGSAPYAMTLGYWVACQRWAFRNCIDNRLDKMILKGGLDMTPAVVDYIYQKYNIPASHRDVIREFLSNEDK